MSSVTPAPRITTPMFRRIRSRSVRMRAITGIAEIESAVARKSAKINRWSGAHQQAIGQRPSRARTRSTNGITMPSTRRVERGASEVPQARRGRSRGPSSSRSQIMPSQAITSRIWNCSGSRGKSASCRSGASMPSTDGPSSTPAVSSPITGGWPRRRKISPRLARGGEQERQLHDERQQRVRLDPRGHRAARFYGTRSAASRRSPVQLRSSPAVTLANQSRIAGFSLRGIGVRELGQLAIDEVARRPRVERVARHVRERRPERGSPARRARGRSGRSRARSRLPLAKLIGWKTPQRWRERAETSRDARARRPA